ncbi:MAG: OmpA family protein [SAR324 cluster bacterium]|nr:OmpA family protein [SAR324 cluster bacterium]
MKPKQEPAAAPIEKKADDETKKAPMASESKSTDMSGSGSKSAAPAQQPAQQPAKKEAPVQQAAAKQEPMKKTDSSTMTPAPAQKQTAASVMPSQTPKKVPPMSVKEAPKKMPQPEPAPKVAAPKKEESTPIAELRTIYFEFDKSSIRSQFINDIKANFEWIRQNPHIRIQLEGHADERGTNEYNLALGERRGNSVLEYLMALGANPEQFSVISFGEERAAMLNCSDEGCYEKNRRVEFTRL